MIKISPILHTGEATGSPSDKEGFSGQIIFSKLRKNRGLLRPKRLAVFGAIRSSGGNVRKAVLVVDERKERFDQIKTILGSDFSVRSAYPAKRMHAEKPVELILLPCDFQCSLDKCFSRFKSMFLHSGIPFAILRFLPMRKKMFHKPAFSLSFFESSGFSPAQMEVINRLRSSESYSRCLILRLGPSHISSKVLAIQTEITENPMEIFSLEHLAKMFGLSPSWLSRTFREMSGTTLQSFLIKNRLCMALWRLVSSDKLIKTIAIELGYHPLSFSQRFREAFGVPPRAITGIYPQKNRYKQK